MEYSYSLQRMEEAGFYVKPNSNYKGTEGVYDFRFGHEILARPESGTLELTLNIEVTPQSSDEILARESVFCIFTVDPFDKIIRLSGNTFSTKEPRLIDTFISVAIGAARGMLVKNLNGTNLQGIVVPLIPMSFIRKNATIKEE